MVQVFLGSRRLLSRLPFCVDRPSPIMPDLSAVGQSWLQREKPSQTSSASGTGLSGVGHCPGCGHSTHGERAAGTTEGSLVTAPPSSGRCSLTGCFFCLGITAPVLKPSMYKQKHRRPRGERRREGETKRASRRCGIPGEEWRLAWGGSGWATCLNPTPPSYNPAATCQGAVA